MAQLELEPIAALFPLGPEWRPWMVWYPPSVLIQWMRPEWDKPVTGFPWDLHPEANVAGLYWRLTGIGKQIIEGLD